MTDDATGPDGPPDPAAPSDADEPRVPDPAPAPDSGAAPDPDATAAAFTDLSRGDPVDGSALVAVDLPDRDRPAALLEPGDRAADARAFAAAVADWERVADHDHVAAVLDSGKKPRPWVASERVPATLVECAPLSTPATLWTVAAVARAVAAAHEADVVHGALGPRHVRLHPPDGHDGDYAPADRWSYPTVGGFGVAGWTATEDPPTGSFPGVLPPEVVEGAAPDPAADVFGLGVVLSHALTGESPFADADGGPDVATRSSPVPPTTADPSLPGVVDDLVLAALSTAPDRRPTLAELRSGLAATLRTETGDVQPSTPTAGPDGEEIPSAFPLFDGPRAEWTAPCPACDRSVNNTVDSFLAHWRDAPRCSGPPADRPAGTNLTDEEFERVAAAAARASPVRPDADPVEDHPLWAALAADDRRVVSVAAVAVDDHSGEYPWLAQPRRGWRVPCPCCSTPVFNDLAAFRDHWRDAPDCSGPPDEFATM
jgi:hypothetical protein